ncbi:hypothetical protein CEP54_015369 [Fusarium duplospermum]|uniref:Uncharacterized protein n=1 Tax=Fusarium duplospermum TaxID=1325734 RepID=A0A428NPT0_9HYPO|nr:hypothetical protein CEP54_015369 [Fusarium duplospermum]
MPRLPSAEASAGPARVGAFHDPASSKYRPAASNMSADMRRFPGHSSKLSPLTANRFSVAPRIQTFTNNAQNASQRSAK